MLPAVSKGVQQENFAPAKSSSFSCGDWECWLPQIDLYNGHNIVAAAAAAADVYILTSV